MPSKHAKTAQRRRQRKAAAKTNTVLPYGVDGARRKRHPARRARNVDTHSVSIDSPPSTADAPSSLRVEALQGPSTDAPEPPDPPNHRSHPRYRNDASGSRPDRASVEAKQRVRRGLYGQDLTVDWRRTRRDARDRKWGPLEAELHVEDGGW